MRKGFFFSLDALIAAIVLISGLLIVQSISSSDRDTTQIATASEDVLAALNGMRLYDVSDGWVANRTLDGNITDLNASVLEQIGYFWALGKQSEAQTLAQIFLDEVYPDLGVRLTIDEQTIYERNGSREGENAFTTTQFITGIASGEAIEGSSASAYLKRIKDKRTSAFVPFGGFVGEGNISVFSGVLPADTNVTDVIIELATDREFDFFINGQLCDHLMPTPQLLMPTVWNRTNCTQLAGAGNNRIDINFTGDVNGSFTTGGYVKIVYTTDEFNDGSLEASKIYTFPGIDGLINLYDGFLVPGEISSMNVTLSFLSNYTSYLTIGNASWEFTGSVTPQTIFLNDSQVQSALATAGINYTQISDITVPLRFGIGTVVITGSPSDTVIVTDTSGSMADCATTSSSPPCPSGDDTKINGAKSATTAFISFMLNSTGPLLGLVEFGSSVKSYMGLTDDDVALIADVNSYTATGGTCICCGVNRAIAMLVNSGQNLFIPRGSTWRHNTQNLGSPPSGWTSLSYNDATWSSSGTAIGWFYSGLSASIPCCTQWYVGDYYHRIRFNVTNASDVIDLRLYVMSDDGARVYLNDVSIDDDYGNNHAGVYWNRNNISVSPALLVEGENILAVRQYHGTQWWHAMVFDLELVANYNATAETRTKNIIVMSDGIPNNECSEQNTGTAVGDAIQSACDAYQDHGIKVYTVGFGADADETTLDAMAMCADGVYVPASDADELMNAFGTIGNAIIDSSSTQRSIIEGDITRTQLHPNSSISATYAPSTPAALPNEIAITLQSEPILNCSGIVELNSASRFLDAKVTSYSGDFWTQSLIVNGNGVYNLSRYASQYGSLGDPYLVGIPAAYLIDGNNSFDLRIGIDASNSSDICSQNNTVIYTIAINLSTARSDAVPLAEGCDWSVETADGAILNLTIPASYFGANSCSFQSGNVTYDGNDAYQLGAYMIFSKLDFKNESRLSVNLNEEDLEVIVTTISGVPYLWGPALARIEVTG